MLVDNDMTCRKVTATQRGKHLTNFSMREKTPKLPNLILCLGHVEWEIENQNVVFKERRSLKFQEFCIC